MKVQEEIAAQRCAAMVGKEMRVLCEEITKKGEISGRTEGNIIVEFPAECSCVGKFARVKVTEARNWILKGELINLED